MDSVKYFAWAFLSILKAENIIYHPMLALFNETISDAILYKPPAKDVLRMGINVNRIFLFFSVFFCFFAVLYFLCCFFFAFVCGNFISHFFF